MMDSSDHWRWARMKTGLLVCSPDSKWLWASFFGFSLQRSCPKESWGNSTLIPLWLPADSSVKGLTRGSLCAWHTEKPLRELCTWTLKLTSFRPEFAKGQMGVWVSCWPLPLLMVGSCYDDILRCGHWYQVASLLECECGLYTITSLRLIFLIWWENHNLPPAACPSCGLPVAVKASSERGAIQNCELT